MNRSALTNPEPLIEQIYASALYPAMWPETLRAVTAHTGCCDMTFQGFRASPSHVETLFSLGAHIDDSVWAKHNEVIAAVGDIRGEFGIRLMRPGHIYHDRDYISEADMRRHPYFQELLRPIGLKYAALLAGAIEQRRSYKIAAGFGLHRTSRQGPLSGVALRRFETLRPHLVRAVRIFCRYGGLFQNRTSTPQASSAACFDLDQRGRVLSMNEEAHSCVQRGLIRLMPDRTLAFANAESTRSVLRAISAASRRHRSAPFDGHILIGRLYWAFAIAPVPIRARTSEGGSQSTHGVVTKLALEPLPTRVSSTSALTPSEERIAWSLAYGHPLREAASVAGVTYETARTQLKRAMLKLGVNSQAALVSLLLLEARRSATQSDTHR